MQLLSNLFDAERDETVGEILFYRAFELTVACWVIFFAWDWGFYIQKISDVVLPLGIANYVDVSVFFDHNLSLLVAAGMTAFTLLGFFRVWRYSYLVALLLMHLQYTSRFSLGEISHGSNLIGMVLVGLALGAIGFSQRREMRRFVMGFVYFFFGLGYTSAAICKLIATGPGWVSGEHLWMWIAERTVDTFSITGEVSYNALQLFALDHHWAATLILIFGLTAEFFGFLIWFRRTRRYELFLLLSMHIGILLSMKINFPANTHLLILLTFPWALWIDRSLERLDALTYQKVRETSLRFA